MALSRLDACNGITSPTPEFPQGIYHYVLPAGTKEHNSSMRCYAGSVPLKELAAAEASGFCYASPPDAALGGADPVMDMGNRSRGGSVKPLAR